MVEYAGLTLFNGFGLQIERNKNTLKWMPTGEEDLYAIYMFTGVTITLGCFRVCIGSLMHEEEFFNMQE